MTVRELIKELIDYNLDAEIVVATDKTYINESGHECKGRMFEIKNIDTFGSCVEILFDDWRDVEITNETLEKRELSEIEKIKAEIKDLHNSHMIHLIDTDGVVDTCLDIIDEHIAELKGENK